MTPAPLARLLLVPALLALSALNAQVLVDESFDSPSEATYTYPSPPDEMPIYHGAFSGWARKGSIGVTYGAALGAKGSGGMLCSVMTAPYDYMAAQYVPLTLPISDPAYITADQLRAYVVEFDAKIPAGREIIVYFHPTGPKDMAARQWASRLVFGTLVGNGEYTRYILPATASTAHSVNAFLGFLRDAHLNGQSPMQAELIWLLPIREKSWAVGDYFQLDNLKVSIAR